MAHRSQSQRILWLLAASYPSWTPAPELGKISLQFGARLFELRRAGWLIENRIEREGTKKRSFYRLGSKPHPQRTKSIPQPMANVPQAHETLLFSNPPKYRDPEEC